MWECRSKADCSVLAFCSNDDFSGTRNTSFFVGTAMGSAQHNALGIARAEPDGTHAETRFRLSLNRTSPFKSVGVSVQSTAGSRGVHTSLNNA